MPANHATRIKTALCSAVLALTVSVPPAGALATGPLHTTDCGWQVVSSRTVTAAESQRYRSSDPDFPTLAAVDALSDTNVWIIGQSIEHWNGSKWRVYKPAGVGRYRNLDIKTLDAIAAVSPTDIWAVGGELYGSLIDHWNGKSWAKVRSPGSDFLSAVAVSPLGDVWAAGGKVYSHGEDEAWVDHWTGTRWTGMVAEPPETDIPSGLTSIAPLAPHDVIAGDVDGASMQWNGASWTATPTPIEILALAPLSPTNVWAAGWRGTAHWDGSSWTQADLALPSGWIPNLKSVSAAGPNDIWAVGEMDEFNSQTHEEIGHRALVVHWNGTEWTRRSAASLHAEYKRFDGISTLPNGDARMVGTMRITKKGGPLPLIEHYSAC